MRRSKEKMFPLMDKYDQSGQSKVEFCRQQGLNMAVFWYWYRKYKKVIKEPRKDFVEVQQIPMGRIKMELEVGDQKLFFYEYPSARYVQDILGIK